MNVPRGPSGFWCRACGRFQSTRSRAETTRARAHTQAHIDAGEQPSDGRPWRKNLPTG